MDVKVLFEGWAKESGVEKNKDVYFAFKAGYEVVQKRGLVIYGATNSHEFDLLVDDLSYWFTEDTVLVKGNKKKRVFLSLENFCRAYVLMNMLVSKARFRKSSITLRKKEKIVKKYYRKRIYLWSGMYFKFLCKQFKVLENRKTRIALMELAARKKWWPLCAWDISMSRPMMRHMELWNIDRLVKRVPEQWKEEMEKFVLTYFSKRKGEESLQE